MKPKDIWKYRFAAMHMTDILIKEKNMGCVFVVMDDDYLNALECPELVRDSRGNRLFVGDWYVVIVCNNGYRYYVNVTADSVITMCAEVFGFIQNK